MPKKRMSIEDAFTTLDEKLDRVLDHIDKQLTGIKSTLEEHSKILKLHTGDHAEHALTLQRLDQERLVGIHRMERIEADVEKLQAQSAR